MSSQSSILPPIGYGTWNRDKPTAYQGVLDALELGYRHIDTAQAYDNEEAVGQAISDSSVSRSDIFICTKVDPVNYGPGQVRLSVESSLKKLQTDEVDLLLLHFPSLHDEYPIEDYVGQFIDVYDSGLCKHIGVSNFTQKYIRQTLMMLDERTLATNQVELHAYMQNKAIAKFCSELDIPITAYSPLARGALLDDSVINEIAAEHQASNSQIALAFLLNKGYSVIPSSANKQRITDNLAATKITLSKQELQRIEALEQGMRLVDADWCPEWDTY
ncbi:aldo/keto reductase [Agaribacterium sp. ZY112]|uniref:aldo/keto reductase n=1 Tax=Agaribacterium sp. ZY112 TaxID=3233574 RepID=UPI003523AA64